MRLGCSDLVDHHPHYYSKPEVCPCCLMNSLETNEHYLMECPKFKIQRVKLLKSLDPIIRRIHVPLNTRELLGFKPHGCGHKKLKELDVINKILTTVNEYIETSMRFKNPSWIKSRKKRGIG